jgi:hypothetical protein
VSYSNDKESQREKFVLIVWIGKDTKVMRKAKARFLLIGKLAYNNPWFQISVHSADVKTVLRVFSIEVAARERDDLKEDPIVVRLRKVSHALLSLLFR